MGAYLIGKAEEFTEGSRKVVSCDGTEIGVFMVGSELVAWHNECSHRQGPICQGRIYKRVLEPVDENGHVRALAYDDEATHIVCPWHGYEYDLKTGVNAAFANFRLKKATLEVKNGEVYVIL